MALVRRRKPASAPAVARAVGDTDPATFAAAYYVHYAGKGGELAKAEYQTALLNHDHLRKTDIVDFGADIASEHYGMASTMEDARRFARESRDYAIAQYAFVSGVVPFAADAALSEIYDLTPALKVDALLAKLDLRTGMIDVTLDDVRSALEADLAVVQHDVAALREWIETNSADDSVLPAQRQADARGAVDEARAMEEHLARHRARLYLLSTVIGFADPDAGRQSQALASAAIDIAQSLNILRMSFKTMGLQATLMTTSAALPESTRWAAAATRDRGP
jgi:hypothetical protein